MVAYFDQDAYAQTIADHMIFIGTENTVTGNWDISYQYLNRKFYTDLPLDKDLMKKIGTSLNANYPESVRDFTVDDNGFHVRFNPKACQFPLDEEEQEASETNDMITAEDLTEQTVYAMNAPDCCSDSEQAENMLDMLGANIMDEDIYDTGQRWRDMLRSQASTLANNMKIPLENFRWYAAFHNESHHPHVHLIAYSTVENEGFLTQKGVMNLRSAYAKSIFAEELAEIFASQAQHRKDLRQESRDMIARVVEQINSNAYDNPAVEQKLLELSAQLTGLGGKKEYKYLRKDLKHLVDDIVSELSSDDRIQQLYDLWYQMREENVRIYTDELPERIPLADNPEFRTFKNAVIQEAMHIVKKEITVEDPEEFSPWHMEIPDEEPEPASVDDEAPPSPKETPMEESTAKKESEYMLWLKELAHQNNSYGQYMLGKILLRDEPTEQDLHEGEMWLRRAIANGNIYARYALGKAMLSGVIKVDDTDEAVRLIEQSADDGASAARYLMGKLLYKGELTDQDIPRAIAYLKDAASQFNRLAAYLLGKILVVEPEHRDIESALSYLERVAKYGNHYAEYFLGKLYLYGKEVPQNTEKALDYLKTAAEHGNPYAAQLLNSVRSNGNWSVAVGSLRLLHHISRMFQNQTEEAMRQNEIAAVDKRIRQKTEEKRQAHGLKHG